MKLWHDYVSVKVLIIPSAANQCKYWKLSSKEEELIKNSGHYFYFSLFSHWAPAQTANSLIVWYIYEGFTLWLDSIAMLMPVCLNCRQKPKGAQSGRAENRWLSGNPVCPSIIDTQSRESRVCVCVCVSIWLSHCLWEFQHFTNLLLSSASHPLPTSAFAFLFSFTFSTQFTENHIWAINTSVQCTHT